MSCTTSWRRCCKKRPIVATKSTSARILASACGQQTNKLGELHYTTVFQWKTDAGGALDGGQGLVDQGHGAAADRVGVEVAAVEDARPHEPAQLLVQAGAGAHVKGFDFVRGKKFG